MLVTLERNVFSHYTGVKQTVILSYLIRFTYVLIRINKLAIFVLNMEQKHVLIYYGYLYFITISSLIQNNTCQRLIGPTAQKAIDMKSD